MKEDSVAVGRDDSSQIVVVSVGYLPYHSTLFGVNKVDALMAVTYLREAERRTVRTPREALHVGAERALNAGSTLGGTLNHDVGGAVLLVDVCQPLAVGRQGDLRHNPPVHRRSLARAENARRTADDVAVIVGHAVGVICDFLKLYTTFLGHKHRREVELDFLRACHCHRNGKHNCK